MNLMQSGLAMQAMQVKANKVAVIGTDKAVEAFASEGMVLVHKPAGLEALRAEKEARRQMNAHTSQEVA